MMFQDNVIRYDTTVTKMVTDTDTVEVYHTIGVGRDFVSYFEINNGDITKVYVTERGDTFKYHDYAPNLAFRTFDLKMEAVKSDINLFETTLPAVLPPVGNTLPASSFIELPQPKPFKPHNHNLDGANNACLFVCAILVYSYVLTKTYKDWVGLFNGIRSVVNG